MGLVLRFRSASKTSLAPRGDGPRLFFVAATRAQTHWQRGEREGPRAAGACMWADEGRRTSTPLEENGMASERRNVPGAPVFLTGLGSDEPVRPPVSAGRDRSVHRSLLISSGLLLKQL